MIQIWEYKLSTYQEDSYTVAKSFCCQLCIGEVIVTNVEDLVLVDVSEEEEQEYKGKDDIHAL